MKTKKKLTSRDKKILKLLGYEQIEEHEAQFKHPDITEFDTFPQYVWKGDTLEDVLKDFTAGVQYATMKSIKSDIQSQMSDWIYLTNKNQ
jgi:hypothetical protein